MKRLLIAAAMLAAVAGCGHKNPATPIEVVKQQVIGNFGYETRDGKQVKVIYTKDGTGVCDYPDDFQGPLPFGHCTVSGKNCSL